jgi:hypothetical protein
MKKGKKQKSIVLNLNANYNPDAVIEVRKYGVVDLKRYLEKIKKNIKLFEEAISKEKTEMKKTLGMIKVLEDDIKQARLFKKHKK